MNKVMTRAQRRTGTRPPGRRDTRRPTGTTPPRIPAGGTAPAPPHGEDRPSPPPRAASTRPADNRPPSSAATAPATPGRPRRLPLPLPAGPAQEASVRAAGTVPARAPRPATRRPPHLTDAPGPAAVPAREPAPAAPRAPVRTPRRPVPQPRPTDHFAELLLAVLSGQRPVHSMLRHTAGRAYDELADLAERGPLRTRGTRPVVRDIGYYVPREGALEVFARIGAGDRLRAMAFRLEQGNDLRWRCTAVELGGPRPPRPHGR
ncbi:Rv3235 family protein [Streptomyces sp. NEAU-W12]|uniref:Rv3235 family protein n=1 Tax=Streptomyces sp. NEAU-W12 TaxID=2994668 RepID=UPI00224B1DEB|nr:Rv3235 family protein [Streptomyces sp. NEAU-W12]MCX2928313.1 Rv3235 family protein [Streptomyces sp. NEAU-W12]